MSYCRRPLERDVYTAIGFRAPRTIGRAHAQRVRASALLSPLSPSRFVTCVPPAAERTRQDTRAHADLRVDSSSWNFAGVTSAQREPIDN